MVALPLSRSRYSRSISDSMRFLRSAGCVPVHARQSRGRRGVCQKQRARTHLDRELELLE
jgi:hypothetical protein